MAMPTARIRSEQRLVVTVVALILGPVFMIGPTALGVALAFGTDFCVLSLLLLPASVAGSVFIAYHMFQNYQWVGLDGDVIRGRRFWTRQYVERRTDQISDIVPLGHAVNTIENVIADKLLGSVHGYEIRFKDGGRKIALVRHDMANVDALIEELADRTHKVA